MFLKSGGHDFLRGYLGSNAPSAEEVEEAEEAGEAEEGEEAEDPDRAEEMADDAEMRPAKRGTLARGVGFGRSLVLGLGANEGVGGVGGVLEAARRAKVRNMVMLSLPLGEW